MLLRYFYDEKLAHASYVVGCQAKGEAVVVDPMRNIKPYIELAQKENMKIVGALETHIHADFVSGSRELADHCGATLYISDEGGADWTYENIEHLNCRLLKDGDEFKIGNLIFETLHTPGHTPESISFLLTDRGGVADKPMGIFTGDFVFVGDIGRPDLLEKAAGIAGTSAEGAKAMYKSLEKFKALPDYLQVWPAHGAGSACGKALGAVPSTTVGYEKQFNWAMQFDNEEGFTKELLEGQPEPPYYFAVMKHVNKVGIELIKNLPSIETLSSAKEVEDVIAAGNQVIDTRNVAEFSAGHIEGTVNIPFNQSFVNWAGWIVDYKTPLYIVADEADQKEIIIGLHSIGIDNIKAFGDAKSILAGIEKLESYEHITAVEAKERLKQGGVHLIDVRNQSEFDAGHIEGAQHIMLGTLRNRLGEVPADKPLIMQCQAGGRSAIAVSILQAHGIKNLVNMAGGYSSWIRENNN